jgi:hypothetical protein
MSNWQTTARSLAGRLVAERTIALGGATVIFVLVGVIALITDSYDLVLLCILALQATIAGYLLTAPDPVAATDDAKVRAAIDRASARTLTDVAHARQSILDAIAEIDPKTP